MRETPSLLVSCCGSYDGSGSSTGGLVCTHGGQTVTIDELDSTGLSYANGMTYRFVRSLQSIIGYDSDGIKYWVHLPSTRDVHDLLIMENEIVCVSTGSNQICWFDFAGQLRRTWQALGEGDAWHLNCLWAVEGRLHASAFGEFESHRGWAFGCTGSGFILDLNSNVKVVDGLSAPHSPRFIDGEWYVCNSHAQSLVITNGNNHTREVRLSGFTRGFAYDSHYFYVGESANRKSSLDSRVSFVAVLDRKSVSVVDRIAIPFPEIYDIILMPPHMAANMMRNPSDFTFDFKDERIEELEGLLTIATDTIYRLERIGIAPLLLKRARQAISKYSR